MTAPTVLVLADGQRIGLGAGGSERIRGALLRVITAFLGGTIGGSGVVLGDAAGGAVGLQEAVDAPRLHWDGTSLQVEPGLPRSELAELGARWPTNVWEKPGFYFGGVQAVLHRPDGTVAAAADGRRGGHTVVLSPDDRG